MPHRRAWPASQPVSILQSHGTKLAPGAPPWMRRPVAPLASWTAGQQARVPPISTRGRPPHPTSLTTQPRVLHPTECLVHQPSHPAMSLAQMDCLLYQPSHPATSLALHGVPIAQPDKPQRKPPSPSVSQGHWQVHGRVCASPTTDSVCLHSFH